MRLASSVLFAALILSACSNPASPSTDLITVTASSHTVQITNNTDDRVYYFAAEQGVLALLDWAACNEPTNTSCTSVEARATAQLPYSQIIGKAAPGAKVVVYHYRLVQAGGNKFKPDSIRSLVVDLE